MKISPIAEAIHQDVMAWRHHIHQYPELSMKEYKTSAFVKERLREMNVPFYELAGTGIVAYLKRGNGNGAVGFRCELDALPMVEANTFPHASRHSGAMHACGHDGHTAMLLGALRALKDAGEFDGTIYFIFQPGEEGAGGGKFMLEDGLFTKCPMQEVYAVHNMPGIALGKAGVVYGPVMAAVDIFAISVLGQGGHAAMPNVAVDPIIAASSLIAALQTLVSRNVNPLESAVLSTTMIHAGTMMNVIPDRVDMEGTVRTFSQEIQTMIQGRMIEMCQGFEKAFSVKIDLCYERSYPVTINDKVSTQRAKEAITKVLGEENVASNLAPCMAGEDFSFMLEKVKGNYLWIGNGYSDNLHTVKFDFNDALIPIGITYWMELAKQRLPKRG